MVLEVLNVAIVVVANGLSASFLHPASLEKWGIAKKSWAVVGEPVSTPILSSVQYSNDLTFIAQADRIQVIDGNPSLKEPANSPVADYAIKILQNLPGVKCTAVGINATIFLETTDPDQLLKDLFLVPNAGAVAKLSPRSISLRLAYDLKTALLTLSYDAGSVEKPLGSTVHAGIIASANFHHALKAQSVKSASLAIRQLPQHYAQFEGLVKSHFSIGG